VLFDGGLIPLLAQAGELGALGTVLLFLCLIVGQLIICVYVFVHVAHCFLHVLERTAAGSDQISWPGELFIDWLGEAVVLAYLLALPVIPGMLVMRALKLPFLPDPASRMAVGVLAGIWLLFPITILSSLLSASPWSCLHPGLLGRLAKRPVTVLAFYVLTGALLAGTGYLYLLAFSTGKGWLWPVGAVAVSSTVFVYARLLGRLAWVAGRTRPPTAKEGGKRLSRTRRARGVIDPWGAGESEPPPRARTRPKRVNPPPAAPRPTPPKPRPEPPPEEEDEWNWQGNYGVAEVEPPSYPEKSESERDGSRAEEPIAMQPLPADDRETQRERKEAARPILSQFEEELLRPEEKEPPPAIPLLSGVYSFPWYPSNFVVWLLLTMEFVLVGFLFHLIRQFNPL
jgi:hypothetical protein